jgi:hypothetical protein
MNIRLLSVIPFALVVACASAPDTTVEENVASNAQALSSSLPLPQGLTCGLWHTFGPSGLGCDGSAPGTAASGFDYIATGDLGMPYGQGFFHNALFLSTTVAASYAEDALPLPRGVVCGLMHTGSAFAPPTCLGHDAEQSCPNGWVRRTAFDHDDGGYSPQNFWAWCEYQDIHALCPKGKCSNNVPLGTVCGLSEKGSTETSGICDGDDVIAHGCPKGWQAVGPRDEGAPSGQGLFWCTRDASGKGSPKTSSPPPCSPFSKTCL